MLGEEIIEKIEEIEIIKGTDIIEGRKGILGMV
jgi:hypothetical protein